MNDPFMLACTASRWTGDIRECRWCAAPLTGRQQRWCSTTCADAASSQHFWSWASKAARRERKACERCGSPDDLQAHHIDPARGAHAQTSCIHHADNIEVLCRPCHVAHHGTHPTGRPKPAAKRVPGFEDAQLTLTIHEPSELAQPSRPAC